jgi:hypothetical protein
MGQPVGRRLTVYPTAFAEPHRSTASSPRTLTGVLRAFAQLIDGFIKKYGVRRLVNYEMHETMDAAIVREKQLARG